MDMLFQPRLWPIRAPSRIARVSAINGVGARTFLHELSRTLALESRATQPMEQKGLPLNQLASTLILINPSGGGVQPSLSDELTSDAPLDPTGLVAVALAHTFAVFVCVSIAWNISGGHLNPAVTLGLAVGGNITLLTGFFYWIAQVLGSIVACLLVSFVTSKSTPTHGLAAGVSPIGGVVIEIVATFALLYTVYATAVDPRKGSLRTIAPIAIGLIVGANILAFGPFSGASMNPARSFGPAVVSGNYADNWIYWVGPLTGGALGGLIYGGAFLCPYNSVSATETHP